MPLIAVSGYTFFTASSTGSDRLFVRVILLITGKSTVHPRFFLSAIMRSNRYVFTLHVTLLLVGLVAFSGCSDTFTGGEETAPELTLSQGKMRHPYLMDQAYSSKGSGKFGNESSLNLILSIDKQSTLERYNVLERYTTLERYNVLERYEYNNVFGGYAITVEDSLGLSEYNAFLNELENDPDIIWYEPDFSVDLPEASFSAAQTGQLIPWSVAVIGGEDSWTKSGNGSGVVDVDVFILDTGVARALANDPDDDLYLYASEDIRDGLSDPVDHDGHGTHIAGIIGAIDDGDNLVGIAPGARIHNLKVLNDDGTTDVSVVVAAIEEIIAWKQVYPYKPAVVNLSIGENIGTNAYTALDEAVEAALDAGIIVVAAAGNYGTDAINVTPAHVEGAITVGSFDVNGIFSSFSNYGSMVDLLAPGEAVISLGIHQEGPKSMSGTSMAAAHVTGAAALYVAQHPLASPLEVRTALLDAARDFVVGEPAGTTNKSVWVGPSETDGLVAYWSMDETTGPTAFDGAGSYDGFAVGPVWSPNAGINGALDFDGVDDYMDLGGLNVGGKAVSFSFRFKADDFDWNDGRFISKATGIYNSQHYWMVSTIDGTALRFRLRAGGTTTVLRTQTGLITTGRWYSVAAVYDGSFMRIYLDGTEVAVTPKHGYLSTNPFVHAAIGNQPHGAGSKPFDGMIDEMRIYSRALSPTEIALLAR